MNFMPLDYALLSNASGHSKTIEECLGSLVSRMMETGIKKEEAEDKLIRVVNHLVAEGLLAMIPSEKALVGEKDFWINNYLPVLERDLEERGMLGLI